MSKTYMRAYRRAHPEYGKNRNQSQSVIVVKTEVMRHYGKGGEAKCCWRNCEVVDIDMLSLDHIADNGAEHRRKLAGTKHRCGGGINLYRKLRREGFPGGFQTLCHNHQWKKEIRRRRAVNNARRRLALAL